MTDFGRGTLCVDSLKTGRHVSGVLLVGQNAYHRLTTPRGALRGGEEEANYGTDLSAVIGTRADRATRTRLEDAIRSELTKDERIDLVTVEIVEVTEVPFVRYVVVVTCTTSDGPFTLKLAVSAVTVELLGLTEGST